MDFSKLAGQARKLVDATKESANAVRIGIDLRPRQRIRARTSAGPNWVQTES